MTRPALMEALGKMPASERAFVRAYLLHLERAGSAANARDLGQRRREMDKGKTVPLRTFKRMHASLLREGL